MTRGISPWRALAQSGVSLKWEDPRSTWSRCLKRNPRPSGQGVCQFSDIVTRLQTKLSEAEEQYRVNPINVLKLNDVDIQDDGLIF